MDFIGSVIILGNNVLITVVKTISCITLRAINWAIVFKNEGATIKHFLLIALCWNYNKNRKEKCFQQISELIKAEMKEASLGKLMQLPSLFYEA